MKTENKTSHKSSMVHLGAKGLLSAFLLMNVGMYLFKTPDIVAAFETFGYPSYLVYPLAAAKFMGMLALWLPVPATLRTFAYAGFTYNFILAAVAHLAVGDTQVAPAVIAFALLVTSFATRHSKSSETLGAMPVPSNA